MNFKDFRQRLNSFWFAPTSPSSLCVFRIFYGLLVIQNGLLLAPDLRHWFGTKAMLTQQTVHIYEQLEPRFSLFFLFPDSDAVAFSIYALLMASAITLTLGFYTRISAGLLTICLLSFHERLPCIFNAGDTILRQEAFLLMFSQAGAMYSIDRWRKKSTTPSSKKIECAPWAQRLLQIHMAFVYFDVFETKIICPDWVNGTAVYYCGRLAEFARFPMPFSEHLWSSQIASWGTIAIEFALCTLIWCKRFRYQVIILGIILHVLIDWAMSIPVFEYVMICGFMLFVEPADMERVVESLKKRMLKLPRSKPASTN